MASNKDKDKENRWARVLADAGLLDEVDDAWDIPSEGIHQGATIEVTPNAPSLSPEVVVSSEKVKVPGREEETTTRVVSVVSKEEKFDNREQEDTKKVSYTSWSDVSDKSGQNQLEPQLNKDKIPFLPVDKESDSAVTTVRLPEPPMKTDTQPSPMVRHSKGAEPKTPVFDHESFRTSSSRPPREDQVVHFSTKSDSLSDSVRQLQEDGDLKEQKFVHVRGSRISIPAYSEDEQNYEHDSIVDSPISVSPSPIDIPPPEPTRYRMAQRYDMGDYSGALEIAEQILAIEPDNFDAGQFKKSCMEKLLAMYESKIGDMNRVPALQVSNHELMWRNLDSSAGFILSRVDGFSTYENIIDISGMPKFETCRILNQLLLDGLIK